MTGEPVLAEPGDVLALRTPGRAGWWIRLGAALAGKPDLSNHVAVFHHRDPHGTGWCIEGRPGGVGWAQADGYLASPYALTNFAQPKTPGQRVKVCEQMVSLLETGYDWDAIAADAADDLGFDWSPSWGKGQVPGHVVCSSLACYAYDEAGLKRPPGNARTDQPADWDEWIISRGWLP